MSVSQCIKLNRTFKYNLSPDANKIAKTYRKLAESGLKFKTTQNNYAQLNCSVMLGQVFREKNHGPHKTCQQHIYCLSAVHVAILLFPKYVVL